MTPQNSETAEVAASTASSPNNPASSENQGTTATLVESGEQSNSDDHLSPAGAGESTWTAEAVQKVNSAHQEGRRILASQTAEADPLLAHRSSAIEESAEHVTEGATTPKGGKPAPAIPTSGQAVKPLDPQQKKRFAACERIITNGLNAIAKSGFEVGRAMREVRDGELYRETHNSFEDYVAEKYEVSRQYANNLIRGALAFDKVSSSTMVDRTLLPKNERQVRPLLALKPEQQPKVWLRAIELAGNKHPTGAHVEQAVKEQHQTSATNTRNTDKGTKATRKDWKEKVIGRLQERGFVEPFEQPLQWQGEGFHLSAPDRSRFVKLIGELKLEDVAILAAAKRAKAKAVAIVDAAANCKESIHTTDDGRIAADSFQPAFNILAQEFDAVVEFDGRIYKPQALDARFQTTWVPLKDAELTKLFPSQASQAAPRETALAQPKSEEAER